MPRLDRWAGGALGTPDKSLEKTYQLFTGSEIHVPRKFVELCCAKQSPNGIDPRDPSLFFNRTPPVFWNSI